MLNFITNQTKQYEAYTERYLKFKVEFRELVPYNKTSQPWMGSFEEISIAFRKLSKLSDLSKKHVQAQIDHHWFLDQVEKILAKPVYAEYALDINQIDPVHYGRFLNLMISGQFDVPTAIKLLDLLKELNDDLLINTNQWLLARNDLNKIELLINLKWDERIEKFRIPSKYFEKKSIKFNK